MLKFKNINRKKTDSEILKWIDDRDVLTMRELSLFMYGKIQFRGRIKKFWDYVLKTKNLEKLKKYKDSKINHSEKSGMGLYYDLMKKDKRLRDAGYKRRIKILESVYNWKVSKTTLKKYDDKKNN